MADTKKLYIRGGYVLVDAADYNYLDQFSWQMDDNGYAKMSVWLKDEKRTTTIRLHQVLMGYKPGMWIDHINRNPSDNRRSNLRFVTPSQNWWNSERGDRIMARRELERLAA